MTWDRATEIKSQKLAKGIETPACTPATHWDPEPVKEKHCKILPRKHGASRCPDLWAFRETARNASGQRELSSGSQERTTTVDVDREAV